MKLRSLLKPPYTLDLVWLVLPFALTLLCFGLLPLRSWDYWWHITMGRLIDHFQAVPAANHYLYTMDPKAPSFIQPWMSQWLLFWLHDVGGLQLALLARNLLAAVVFGFVGVAAIRRTRSPMRGALVTMVGLLIAFQLIALRTHMFVWPLFGLLLWVGYQVRRRRFPLALVAVFPAVAALWANLHGSFLLVAAIALAFAGAAVLDRWMGAREFSAVRVAVWVGGVLASLAAPMLNPRGAQIYGYVADLMSNHEIRTTVTEWMPTSFSNPAGIGVFFYVVLVAGAALMWRNRDKLDPADALLFAGFGLVAALGARGLMWFGIVVPVTLAPYLAMAKQAQQAKPTEAPGCMVSLVNLGLAFGLLVAAGLLQPGTVIQREVVTSFPPIPVRTDPPMAGLVPADTPVVPVEILRKYPKGMHLFHDQRYAGYLMYQLTKLHPMPMVFVDQRIELPPAKIWKLYALTNSTSAWKGIFQQYDIRAAVLNKKRQAKLVERMRQDTMWTLAYEDAHNALFVINK